MTLTWIVLACLAGGALSVGAAALSAIFSVRPYSAMPRMALLTGTVHLLRQIPSEA
jgi:hypothetical protein